MASVVSIQIRVDDGNSVETISKVEQALGSVGVQGTASIHQAGAAMDKLGGHTASSLDAVRLLSQEFGFRLPRALESMLSRMPQVAAGLQAMIGGLAGFAGAEVIERMGEAAYHLYERFVSIQEPVDKFRETLQKASEIDFANVRSLETLRFRYDYASTNAALAPGAAKQLRNQGLLDLLSNGMGPGSGAAIGEIYGARQTAESGATSMQQQQDLANKRIEMEHQTALDAITRAHAADGELGATQKIVAERQKAHAIDAENRDFTNKMEGAYGNPVSADAGAEEQRNKDAVADAEAHVKLVQLGLEQQLAIMKAQNEAREAGLQGEALYAEKRKDAIAQLRLELAEQHELAELPARQAAMEEQFDNERKKRTRELVEQTSKSHDEAASAGLTGSARILAEGRGAQNRIDEAESSRAGAHGTLTEEDQLAFDQQRIDADAAMHQKLKELEDNFTDHAKEMAQQRTDAQLGEFGKIEAEGQHTLAALKKTYDDDVAGLKDDDQLKIDATAAYNAAVLAIEGDTAQKKKELRERNAQEDAQYDHEAMQAEARVKGSGMTGWVGQHRAAIDAIRQQETERLQKIDEDAKKEGLTEEEVQKRRMDVTREANAEIQQQQQEAAHQLAGTLESIWDNPMKALKEKGKQAMFELIANWMMQTQMFKTFFGGAVGSAAPAAASSTAGSVLNGGAAGVPGIGGILGRVLGIPSGTRAPGTGGVIDHGTTLPAGYNDGGDDTTGGAGGGDFTSSTAGSGVGNLARFFTSGTNYNGNLPDGFDVGSLGNLAKYFPNAHSGGQSGGNTTASIPGVGGGSTTAMSSVAGVAGLAGTAMAGYAGAEGVLDNFHKSGVGGALGGITSGAELGGAIGSIVPGLGTLIGAGVGAAIGLGVNIAGDVMGMGGNFAARDYYKQSIQPQLDALMSSPNRGGNYMDDISQVNSISSQGMSTMAAKFGQSAANWVNQNYMQKEVTTIDGAIVMRAQGGSAYTGMAAKQFHGGGRIDGFGDFATSSTEGLIHARLKEGIVTEPAMATHGVGVGMINNGASASEMAAHYLAMGGGNTRASAPSSGGGHNFHIHAWDGDSVQKWLKKGGAKAIIGGINNHAANYAGDGQV